MRPTMDEMAQRRALIENAMSARSIPALRVRCRSVETRDLRHMRGAVWRVINDPKTFLKRGMLKRRLATIDAVLAERECDA